MPDIDDRLARALADYDNLRKKVNERVEDAQRSGENRAINELLDPLDNLHRAIAQLQDVRGRGTKKKFLEALDLVARSFDSVLARLDIERVEVAGQPYNADTMDAVGQLPANGVPAGHVAGQVRPAYIRSGKLLRDAQVVVAVDKGKS